MNTFNPCIMITAASLLVSSQFALAEPDIEVIHAPYLTAIDYALYEYTAETIALLRLEVTQQISIQARAQLLNMAENMRVYPDITLAAQLENKHLPNLWLSHAPE